MSKAYKLLFAAIVVLVMTQSAFAQNGEASQIGNNTFDTLNRALRVNAVASGGGASSSGTFLNLDQLLSSVYDPTHGALKVNIVSGLPCAANVSGTVACTATGTNQNITLTPSGTGASVISNLQDKGGQVFNVKAYGAVGDGTTDDTVAMQAAIAAANAAGGGVIYFPAGTYLIAGALVIPNGGQSPVPAQNPLRFTGALQDGSSSSGLAKAPAGGAILNLTETTNTVAKIDTRGAGFLEIDHLTLEDTGGDAVPFVQTTNTILSIHNNSIVGSKNTVLCDQDAIILGSSTTTIDGSATAAFQGYGTVIRDNWFNHIRRAVYGLAFANGVQVVDNTVWAQSGSNLAAGAAIEFDGTAEAPGTDTGNYISGNLIEAVGYVYGIKLTHSEGDTITGNSVFDGGAGFLNSIDFVSSAVFNTAICGYGSAKVCAVDNAGSNTVFDGSGNGPTNIGGLWNFTYGAGLKITNSAGPVYGVNLVNGVDATSWQDYATGGSAPSLAWRVTPSGGSLETDLLLTRNSATAKALSVGNAGDSYDVVSSADGDLRVLAGGVSGVTWIGGATSQPTYFSSALMHVGTKAAFTGQIVQSPVAYASAPTCNSGNEGSVQAITDSTLNTWGSTIAGGGADHVLGYCDGTNWTVAAK